MKTIAGLAPQFIIPVLLAAGSAQASPPPNPQIGGESGQRDARMQWWREARFGMFIHWGLYSIPAGEWGGSAGHGEWIMHTAQIPVETYEGFRDRFNPVKFDADSWVRLASKAGMKYIVITSKHHDGFCLFDSAYTDYDVSSTPFKRDLLKELADACHREGMRICWYHSIMDWHHPDYLPRRDWEKRPAEGADYSRYVRHLKNQICELLTNYGPIGVMWFDGEWEGTWTHEHGLDLCAHVRKLQPDVIVNNRVDKGRGGMAGMTSDARFAGDFGTPEQEIPSTGLPGVDWETCMTMNTHWGYNKNDHNWKSTQDLVRKLADIASKGGNFLLNVGPTAEGEIPPASVERLEGMGSWLTVNGEAVYGTQAGPFKPLPWGRCTQRLLGDGGTRLYLHVFDWPERGELRVPGLFNEVRQAYLLADVKPTMHGLTVSRDGDAVLLRLPAAAPDPINAVVVLDIDGRPDVSDPPAITAQSRIFVDALEVSVTSGRDNVSVRYTTDGTVPTAASTLVPGTLRITETTTVSARVFRADRPVSGVAQAIFTRVDPRPACFSDGAEPGLAFEYYEGDWDRLPDFDRLKPAKTGTVANFEFSPRAREERFAFRYRGFLSVPATGVYTLSTWSDDGSQLHIGDELVVDNDGLHGMREASGEVALSAGAHPITVTYFEKTGGDGLEVWCAGPNMEKRRMPDDALTHRSQLHHKVQPIAPSPRQMAWQELEFIAFLHFGINTFTDREWGDGTEDPALFNPSDLDARQWVRVCQDAGMKQVILSAKHHDGFCLWPSRYTEHSVKNSPWRGGRGDVVRELADACREYGLKLGIYLSPWDRHEPSYGDSPRYNEHFKNQLTELLTDYGPVHEVWFDGACAEGPNGKKQVYGWDAYVEVVRRLQPHAVVFSDAGPDVRWVGNEDGYAGETNWSMLRRDEFFPGTPEYKQLTEGHEDGTHWVPAECDVSMRPGWFYHASQDDSVKTLEHLLDIYYKSVGRNAVLLLNVPPDRRGLIHENDAARLAELRAVLDQTFKVNLAAGRIARASGVHGKHPEHRPDRAIDGDRKTYWLAGDAHAPWLEIDLGAPETFDRAMIQEAIELGQRVRSFALDAWGSEGWSRVVAGTTIGYKRLLRFEAVSTSRLRLLILDSRGTPAISEVGLYKSSPRE